MESRLSVESHGWLIVTLKTSYHGLVIRCRNLLALKIPLMDRVSFLTGDQYISIVSLTPSQTILKSFRNSDKYYHDPEECEYAGPKVTTSHEGNIPQNKDNKRFQVDGDLKKAKRSLKFPMGTKITT
ncbi:hypothetical protein Tco_1054298 [Tanacetum coccineum]|uniref:Uncharacterized protein n=1 Tax=Tanacetum coccineum TaxID=301880 RepID=A0ABQ5GWD0_9ASTR